MACTDRGAKNSKKQVKGLALQEKKNRGEGPARLVKRVE